LRVNLARVTRAAAAKMLAEEGIETAPHPLAETALQVLGSTRKILMTQVYLSGLVELQDAASQAVVTAIPLADGQTVLDYCAGGGGKSLALAAAADVRVWAYDQDAARMRDLPARSARAGARITVLATPSAAAPYDVVLVDAPCSGSGSWRRDPVGKWALTEARLQELLGFQADIMDQAARLVAAEGVLAYATCSLLADENADQVARFLGRNADWTRISDCQFTPLEGGDGFYLAILSRKNQNNRQVEGVFSSVLSPN
jgi:16S rRNA (cytosine967-C5)-methyltransferase